MNPANAKLVCGAECGIPDLGTASGGTEHWVTNLGGNSPTVVTSGPTPMRSTRAFRFNGSSVDIGLRHTFATAIASGGTGVGRLYVYFASLPTSTTGILLFLGATSGFRWGAWFDSSDNTIKAGRSTGASPVLSATGVAVTTGVWYRIDVKAAFAATHSADVQVDGTAATQVTQAVAAETCATVEINFDTGSHTMDTYIDDIIISGTSGDYPIGAGTVVGLYPNGDKPNASTNPSDDAIGHFYSAAGDFGKGSGGATNLAAQQTESTSWQSLQNPLSTSIPTNFIADLLGASTEHLVWTLQDLPVGVTVVNGVMLVATTHSAAATANNQSMKIGKEGTTNRSTAWSLLDLSETTITVPIFVFTAAADGGAWSVANVNSALVVWGDSSDVNPDPFLDGVCLEVDVLIYQPRVVQVNQAVQRMVVM